MQPPKPGRFFLFPIHFLQPWLERIQREEYTVSDGSQIHLKPSGRLSFFSVKDLYSAAVTITDKMHGLVERDAVWFKLWGQTQPLSLNPPPRQDSNHPSQGHHGDPEQPVAAIGREEQRGHTELVFAAFSHCRSSALF